jgi:glycosyltransferase involved in cell wall biosynthesis
MNKKIAIVIRDLKSNGAERVAITLAEGFLSNGYSPYIICFKKDIQLPIKEEIPILIFSEKIFRWLPRRIRGLITAPFLDLFIKIKLGNPCLILSNLIPSDRILAYSRFNNVYCIIHNTTSIEIARYHPRKKAQEINERIRIYQRKPCICVSEGVRQDLVELLNGCDIEKITKIHNGIRKESIVKASDEIPNDLIGNCIIHVGKFNVAKRQDRLIHAYHSIKCDYPLVFIGTGPRLDAAKELAMKLNLSHKIHFLGYKKNPYPYIKNARLMVLCSDFEGLGMVILEAISLNTPIISSNCPNGPTEILDDEHLFDYNDEQQFQELLTEAVVKPEDFKTTLKDQFYADHMVKKYSDLIN